MKKIIVISLLLIILANIFNTCFAFNIGTKELKDLGECEIYLKYKGVEKSTHYVVYEKDGKNYPAYCLNSELNGVGTEGVGEYSVIADGKVEDERVWKAITNGFPYRSIQELGAANEKEAYTATKFAVYTLLQNRNPEDYSPVNSEAGQRTYQVYLKIVNDAKASTESVQNDVSISISEDTSNWNIDTKNPELVSKVYTLNSKIIAGTYKISLEGELPEGIKLTDINDSEKDTFNMGEKFKISIPIRNLVKDGEFTIKAIATLDTKPIAYGRTTIAGTQNYALTGYMYEDSTCTYKDEYQKNITKIQIIKQEYGTEKRLKGVKFNLLDANKNIIKEGIETDENGEINLENMLPGLYYLQEKETLNEYNLYTDLIEVNLNFNEEFQVIVNNALKSITEVDKTFENVKINSKYEENIENVTNIEKTKKLPVTGY